MRVTNLLATTVLSLATAAGAPIYQATYLGVLPGRTTSSPWDINDLGQVTGDCAGQAFLWTPATGMVDLGPGRPISITNSGMVGGPGFLWSSATGQITPPTGFTGHLNNNGDMTLISSGQVYVQNGSSAPTAIGAGTRVAGISDTGYVAGARLAGSSIEGFLYVPGSGMTATPIAIPNGVNSQGVVIGRVGGVGHYYSLSTGLVRLPGVGARTMGINDLGDIVGDASSRAALFSGGAVYDLNTLTTGLPAGVKLLQAMGINNSGQIIVWASLGQGMGTGSYLLTPASPESSIPEPATLWLIGAALAVAAVLHLPRVSGWRGRDLCRGTAERVPVSRRRSDSPRAQPASQQHIDRM